MTLIESMSLPGPPERAWELLAERGGALRLTPGLSVSSGGRGTVRMVVGGHSLTYRGYARQHVEEPGRHLTWTMSGKEVRGTGRAHAEVRARFRAEPGGGTDLRLTVLVDGRGRLAEVSEAERDRAVSSVIARFKRAVAKELAGSAPAAPPAKAQAPSGKPEERPSAKQPPAAQSRVEIIPPAPPERERTITIGPAALGAAALAVAALVLWWRRRR